MASLTVAGNVLLAVTLLLGLLLLFLAVRAWTPRASHRRSLALFSGAGALWTVAFTVVSGLLPL